MRRSCSRHCSSTAFGVLRLTGLEVGHVGTGMTLIRAEVFQALDPPWFEFGWFGGASGGEDTWFSLKAWRAGFRTFVDLDTPVGHLLTVAAWPSEVNAHGAIAAELKWM